MAVLTIEVALAQLACALTVCRSPVGGALRVSGLARLTAGLDRLQHGF